MTPENMNLEIGNGRLVSELSAENGYTLLQIDYEISDIMEYIGDKEDPPQYMFVKHDKSGADIGEVWRLDASAPYVDAWAYLIYFKE
jgi:hypothetical protein